MPPGTRWRPRGASFVVGDVEVRRPAVGGVEGPFEDQEATVADRHDLRDAVAGVTHARELAIDAVLAPVPALPRLEATGVGAVLRRPPLHARDEGSAIHRQALESPVGDLVRLEIFGDRELPEEPPVAVVPPHGRGLVEFDVDEATLDEVTADRADAGGMGHGGGSVLRDGAGALRPRVQTSAPSKAPFPGWASRVRRVAVPTGSRGFEGRRGPAVRPPAPSPAPCGYRCRPRRRRAGVPGAARICASRASIWRRGYAGG